MNNEEFGDLLVEMAKETRAIRDVMALICNHLSGLAPDRAASAAALLEGIATDERFQQTESFVSVAMQAAAALRGQDAPVLSLKASPRRQDHEKSRPALRVVKADFDSGNTEPPNDDG